MRLQVDQTGTAGKEDHVVSGLQQLAGVHAADHTSAEHKNPQPVHLTAVVAEGPLARLTTALGCRVPPATAIAAAADPLMDRPRDVRPLLLLPVGGVAG